MNSVNAIWSDFFFFSFFFFGNKHFHDVVSTLINILKLDVDKDNVFSTLPKVVCISVEIHNVDSTLYVLVNPNVEIHHVVSTMVWHWHISTKRQRWNNFEMITGMLDLLVEQIKFNIDILMISETKLNENFPINQFQTG